MARAAVKAKQQQARAQATAQQAKASRGRGRRGHASGGNPNQQLFFMKLRRRQRWLFLGLALIFALSFVFIGVGTGAGSGLDQLYSGIFGGSGAGTSITNAEKEIAKNPAKGYQDLALAYETKGDKANAITALQNYLKVKPKDAAAWGTVASLQLQQAQTYGQAYQAAQQAAQLAAPGTAFAPSGTLGQAFSNNPVDQYYTQQSSGTTSQLYQQATTAEQGALSAYQKVAQLQPRNAEAHAQIAQTASSMGNYALALSEFKKFLQLDPHSPIAPQVRKAVTQLQALVNPPKPPTKHKKK